MQKFNRVYSLKMEVDTGISGVSPLRIEFQAQRNVEIALPYTVEFEVNRKDLSSAQTATFRILNLQEKTRIAIQKDLWRYQNRAIQFRAGYASKPGEFIPLIFNGQIKQAYSYRKGVDFITEIEAFDGGLSQTFGFASFAQIAGSSAKDSIIHLSKLLPYQSGTPIVGDFPTKTTRGEVFAGNIWELILKKSGGVGCIDNGQVKVLNPWEVLEGSITTVTSASGLLGSPKRSEQTLDFEMIFEPRLTLLQQLYLDSSASKQYNHLWKVVGFQHRGTISPNVSGDCLTSVRLLYTMNDMRKVEGVLVK